MLSSLSIMATDFKDCSMAIKSNISTNIEKSYTTVFINGNTFSINGLKYDNTDLGNVELTIFRLLMAIAMAPWSMPPQSHNISLLEEKRLLPTSVVRYATANSAAFST